MDRPYVVCHMLTSLDGRIDGEFFSAPECLPAVRAYGELRARFDCSATLYGRTTMLGGFADGLVGALPEGRERFPREDWRAQVEAENYIVSLDPEGTLRFNGSFIERRGRPKAHGIEALTERVSDGYLACLRRQKVSYLFAGEDRIDFPLLLRKLQERFGIARLMIAGGGQTNWSFTREGLIDELSVVIAPLADGGTHAATLFDRMDDLPPHKPAAFSLQAVERLDGDALWLRYARKE